jgi:hypothetical protein
MWVTSVIIKSNCPKLIISNWAKIRPIWSPWLRLKIFSKLSRVGQQINKLSRVNDRPFAEFPSNPEPILLRLNLQPQRQRCSRLERFYITFVLKTCHAISCAVNFYNASVVTQDRRIGSWSPCSTA